MTAGRLLLVMWVAGCVMAVVFTAGLIAIESSLHRGPLWSWYVADALWPPTGYGVGSFGAYHLWKERVRW